MANGRVAGSKNLVKGDVVKIWNLHEAKVSEGLIADTVGFSVPTIRRVIECVGAVVRGEDIDEIECGYRLKDIALELFGGSTEEAEAAPDKPRAEDTERVREYAGEVLALLHEMVALIGKQNELLHKFCEEFGVEGES